MYREDGNEMTVKCRMDDCKYWKDGECTAEEIEVYQGCDDGLDISEYMNPPETDDTQESLKTMNEEECYFF